MKKIKILIKIFLSLFLIIYVLSKIDIQKLIFILKESNIFYLFLSFIFYNVSKIVSSIRLNYYFKDIGINLKEKKNLILYYIGMFYNLFLPGGIGGDGYKIYLLRKRFDTPLIDLVNATILDRLSGLVALLFLALILFLFSSFSKIFYQYNYYAIFLAIVLYPIFLYIHKKIYKKFSTYIAKTTILGIFVQILQLISAFFIIISLPGKIDMLDFLTLFLISSVVSVLPITFGGVGAREVTFLYGAKILNINPSFGIAFSFEFFLITALSSMIGVFFIHKKI